MRSSVSGGAREMPGGRQLISPTNPGGRQSISPTQMPGGRQLISPTKCSVETLSSPIQIFRYQFLLGVNYLPNGSCQLSADHHPFFASIKLQQDCNSPTMMPMNMSFVLSNIMVTTTRTSSCRVHSWALTLYLRSNDNTRYQLLRQHEPTKYLQQQQSGQSQQHIFDSQLRDTH